MIELFSYIAPSIALTTENCTTTVENDYEYKVVITSDRDIPVGTPLTTNLDFGDSYFYYGNSRYELDRSSSIINLLGYNAITGIEENIVQAAATTTNALGPIAGSMLAISQIRNLGSTSIIGAAFATEMLQLHRYININNPQNLLAVYRDSDSSPISLTIAPTISALHPDSFEADKGKYIDDQGPWEMYEVTAYFITGIHPSIITASYFLVTWIVVRLIFSLQNRLPKKVGILLSKMNYFLGFNFLLVVLLSFNIQFSFHAFTNIKYPVRETAFGRLNLTFSLIYVASFLIGITILIKFLLKVWKQKDEINLGKNYRLGIFYLDCRRQTLMQFMYFPITLIRTFLFSFILVFCRQNLVNQLFFLILLSFWYMIYLIQCRPIKSRAEFGFQLFADGCVLLVGVLKSVLASFDLQENWDIKNRMLIGWLVIAVHFLLIVSDALIGFLDLMKLFLYILRGPKQSKLPQFLQIKSV